MTVVPSVVCAGCFLVGWLGIASLVGPLLPPPRLPVLSEKHAYFHAHADQYEAVFIGSSRVFRGFAPLIFDAALQEHGHSLRTFNFAMEAVWPPESFYRVHEFLRLRSRVRWVFIELLPVNPRLTPDNARTLRSIYWHDWRHTLLAWRAIAGDGAFTPGEKRRWIALHAELFLRRLARISSASAPLEPVLRPEVLKTLQEERSLNSRWIDTGGFVPEPNELMPADTATAFREQVAAYVRNLTPRSLPEYLRAELRDLVAAVRARGAVPVFVVTPSTSRAENFADLRDQGIDADLISFKGPARFPALYDPALHFDGPHLNEQGAHEFSRLFADEFAALLERNSSDR